MKTVLATVPPPPLSSRAHQGLGRRDHQPVTPRVRRRRLWLPLPLTPILLVLAPFAILLSGFCALAPRRYRVNGPAAAAAIGGMLLSLSGTVVEVRSAEADVFIRIF